MKRIELLLLCILMYSIQLAGQTKESSIRELLDIENYETDKEAGAAIIYDYGETDFFQDDNGFYTKFTRKQRIKFFNDTKLGFSEIDIPIYFGEVSIEEIVAFKAVVYNLNDGLIVQTQTDKKELLEEKISKKRYNYKVAVAGVKAGSVMDVEYTVKSPFLYQLHDWQFQYSIPVLYSEYIAHMIPFYTYSYIIKGTNQLNEMSSTVETGSFSIRNIDYKKVLYKFVKSKIPAFYSDEYITSDNDYLISLDFQLAEVYHLNGYKEQVATTWPILTEDLIKDYQNFGGYIRGCKRLAKKVLDENEFSYSNNQQYIEQLVNYVKNNFDWNLYHGYLADLKPGDFERTKKGNVAAINLFLVALLREAGLAADPVILSTRNNGKIYTKYPFSHYFNYTIVLSNADGKDFLLDASEKETYFNQIPQRCINEQGLIVKKGEEKWVNLTSNIASSDFNTFYYQFNSNADSLVCTYSCKETGYYALNSRVEYNDDSEKFIEENINPKFEEITGSKFFELDSSRSFCYMATGLISPTRIDKYTSIKPFLNTVNTNNPFKIKERAYPVDFIYARKRFFSAQIVLPEGAKLAKQPENYEMDNNNFSLKYNVSLAGNAVIVNAEYSLKKPVYDPSLYPGLRYFFDNIIKFLNQNIEIQLQ